MRRFASKIAIGLILLLSCFSISHVAFAQVTEILPVGGTIIGTIGAERAQVEYTLDLPAGEWVTLTVDSQLNSIGVASLVYEVKDANGASVHFIPPGTGVFWTGGAPPYILSIDGVNASFSVRLESGDTRRADRGTATVDSHITGQITGQQYDAYMLDVEAGALITIRYTDTHFVPTLYASEIMDDEGRDQRIVQSLLTADQMDVDPFYVSYRIVYRITGEPLYSLFVSTTQNEPGEMVSYDIQIDSGDTLERESLGTLATGQKLEGLLPDENGIYDFIQLEVEAGKTYSIRQWGDTDVRFIIVDDALSQVPSDESPATNSLTFAVAEDHVLPLYLMVEVAAQNAGEPFVFTLAEGEEALPPEEAVAAVPGDAAQIESTDAPETVEAATAAPVACTVTSKGESRQRVGPGTNYELTGLMGPGATAVVDGQAVGSDGLTWWRLAESVWVRSDLVDETGDCESVPVVPA